MNERRHPSEEQLMEFAISGDIPEVKEHIADCLSCGATVNEFRLVNDRVVSLVEDEVPQSVERHILNVTRHGHRVHFLQALFSNPFLIALAVGIVVILLYFLVGSEVFKGQ
jgi:hypothetical protein